MLILESFNNPIFGSPILPHSDRKFCRSSTFISSSTIRLLCSCSCAAGVFLGRPFGLRNITFFDFALLSSFSAAQLFNLFLFHPELICNLAICVSLLLRSAAILVHVCIVWTQNDPPVVVLISSILQQEGVLFHCLFSFKQSSATTGGLLFHCPLCGEQCGKSEEHFFCQCGFPLARRYRKTNRIRMAMRTIMTKA